MSTPAPSQPSTSEPVTQGRIWTLVTTRWHWREIVRGLSGLVGVAVALALAQRSPPVEPRLALGIGVAPEPTNAFSDPGVGFRCPWSAAASK